MKTALIAGASGLTGRYCLDYLLNSSEYSTVISIGRKILNKDHSKLRQIISDFSDLPQILSEIHCDDVFSCLGSTMKKAGSKEAFIKIDFEIPFTLACVAKERGAEGIHFVSAISANKKSFFFYNQVKGQLEEEIIKLGFENINILRPSIIDGDRKESRLAEKAGLAIMKLLSPLMIASFVKYRPVHAKEIAFVMVYMATKGIKGLTIIESDQIHNLYQQHGNN